MASAPPVGGQATPTKGTGWPGPDAAREQVAALNRLYNLGVALPEARQSPAEKDKRARRDTHFRRHNSIVNLVRFHYSKGPAHFQAVLDDFDQQARTQTSNWVRKPRATRSLLPEAGSASVPRALLAEDQTALQELLLDVLEASRWSLINRPAGGASPAAEPAQPAQPGRRHQKQHAAPGGLARSASEEKVELLQPSYPVLRFAQEPRQPPKPPGAQRRLYVDLKQAVSAGKQRDIIVEKESPDNDADLRIGKDGTPVLDEQADDSLFLPSAGPSRVREWESDFWTTDSPPRSPSTVSTVSMYSARDSFEEETPFETQTTAADSEADSDNNNNNKAGANAARLAESPSPSEESFPLSEAELEAFEASFNSCDYEPGSFYRAAPPSNAEQPPDSPTNTAYSSLPELADLRLSDDADTTGPKEKPTTVPGLWDRLMSVFPPTPGWLQRAPFPVIWEATRIALYCGVNLQEVQMTYSPSWEDQNELRKAFAQHASFADKRLPARANQIAWETAFSQHTSHHGGGGGGGGVGVKRVVVFTAELVYNRRASGPLYFAKLQPLALDLPHRLSRQFGADRFVELLFPSHHSDYGLVPRVLRNDDVAVDEVNRWLTSERHAFVGRRWAAFFLKDVGYKKSSPSKSFDFDVRRPSLLQKRVYLFAEDGFGISTATAAAASATRRAVPAHHNDRVPQPMHTPLPVHAMLDWLLQYNKFPENRNQPYLKLFSRVALGLSRTKPTVVFEPHQIRHQSSDIRSPSTGAVMNDGIARMSLSVARKLRSALELSDLPTAVQGRLGSAKGMWLLDPDDTGREDWIETYPSQRKWQCDFADENQRTLEVRNFAAEVRSASLNLQFIPVLEDRALDKRRMRRVIGGILAASIRQDLDDQRRALEHPLLFASWVHENQRDRNEHVLHSHVPFLGGLPDKDEDVLRFLLDGGFDPLQQRYLWDKAYELQKQKCERLREKLNVRIGRTAYLYMVVDFLGVLEAGEVQVCFSTKFQVEPDGAPDPADAYGGGNGGGGGGGGDDGSFSDTLLVGTDLLVARSPAHFPSDMQKVRAVFRPELCALKDVIVFSSKGDRPLADKLSGGDYDGDMAWVCWDPRIVDNFANGPEPPAYDLFAMGYLRKVKTTVDDLATECGGSGGSGGVPSSSRSGGGHTKPVDVAAPLPALVVDSMVQRSFAFNMRESLLGKLTVYKEELCYLRNSISDPSAYVLSTLLSALVDQAKQGSDFGMGDFKRLRVACLEGVRARAPPPADLRKPRYKGKNWPDGDRAATHIIDHLKFEVAKPLIDQGLKALSVLHESTGGSGGSGISSRSGYWDPDLAAPAKAFAALGKTSDTCYAILEALKSDLLGVKASWDAMIKQWNDAKRSSGAAGGAASGTTADASTYSLRVLQVYEEWCNVSVHLPRFHGNDNDKNSTPAQRRAAARAATEQMETVARLLEQPYLRDAECSQWAILRASQAFLMFYNKRPRLVWRLGGRQLQIIKASMSGAGGGGTNGARVLMTPLAYAASRPDKKMIRRMTAHLRGDEVEGIDYDTYDDFFEDDT
ncbi:RNA-dependent RNA polymerase [Niveomyces insectorum RCEF 264]|uniref:RNA-dependent RNA polymerase n=1 Tax=Niveomyces insectorum RCEF 264 TaxID=1081102 RepID=A0A167P702_9HYPO|nr:RNA-dependent RNA polymerase [Niveomyces insectorum RCEF 264]